MLTCRGQRPSNTVPDWSKAFAMFDADSVLLNRFQVSFSAVALGWRLNGLAEGICSDARSLQPASGLVGLEAVKRVLLIEAVHVAIARDFGQH